MRPVKLFFSAVAFLTRLPVPQRWQVEPQGLASSAVFFPLVGLLVSGGAIVLNRVFSRFVPRDVMMVIILVYLVVVTGGFHEDALADAADGFGGGMEQGPDPRDHARQPRGKLRRRRDRSGHAGAFCFSQGPSATAI